MSSYHIAAVMDYMHNDDDSLKEFKDMENMLTKLESVFARNDFWYSLNRYVCVGFKK